MGRCPRPGRAPATNLDPIAGQGDFVPPRYPKTSTDVLVAYDPSSENYSLPLTTPGIRVTHKGWHLGGVRVGPNRSTGDHWLWKASPTVANFVDGLGSFILDYETGTKVRPYAGTVAMAAGRSIIYGYHGEFFHGAGNASQWMHFYDDGLFVGQFGTPYDPNYEVSPAGAVPGSSALPYFPSLVMVDHDNNEAAAGSGETYLWSNDLSSNAGVVRWHILGANQIQEMSGTVKLGGKST